MTDTAIRLECDPCDQMDWGVLYPATDDHYNPGRCTVYSAVSAFYEGPCAVIVEKDFGATKQVGVLPNPREAEKVAVYAAGVQHGYAGDTFIEPAQDQPLTHECFEDWL